MTFEEARAQFPALERLAYLNAGSVGPLARATMDAVTAEHERDLAHGRGSKARFDEVIAMREQLRVALASLVGADAGQVALTASTTEACRIVLAGLDLRADDEIVTTDVEHFGLSGAVGASAARVRVAAVHDRPAGDALEVILGEVTPRTKLIALSHVAWTTGHVLPVAELADRSVAPLLVDGAQSVGVVPVEAPRYDFYTVSGQKWLCGPDATGALVVRDPERLRSALPSHLSQESYEPDGSFVPKAGAARFDAGWMPTASIAGLLAALETAPGWGNERAREAAVRCRELLAEQVEVVTEPGHATLVSWRTTADPADVVARAAEAGVIIRELPALGWLRASCGWWTSDEDLARLVAVATP